MLTQGEFQGLVIALLFTIIAMFIMVGESLTKLRRQMRILLESRGIKIVD